MGENRLKIGRSQKKASGFPEAFIKSEEELGVFLLAFLLSGSGYLGSFLNFTLFGRAVAAVDFNGSTSGKLGWAIKTSHFGLTADLDFHFFFSSLEGQSLGLFVKANELTLDGFGRATCEDGACECQGSKNCEYFFHDEYGTGL